MAEEGELSLLKTVEGFIFHLICLPRSSEGVNCKSLLTWFVFSLPKGALRIENCKVYKMRIGSKR